MSEYVLFALGGVALLVIGVLRFMSVGAVVDVLLRDGLADIDCRRWEQELRAPVGGSSPLFDDDGWLR